MDADTLVRAIRAALDETERIAQAAEGACWHVDYCDDYGQPFHELFDPAAVLRRVAADRRVLERHQPVEVWIGHEHGRELHKVECSTCRDGSCTDDYDMVCGTLDWPCPEIRDLCDRLGINLQESTNDR